MAGGNSRGSGSGKTAVANELVRRIRKGSASSGTGAGLGSLLLDMDAYYAPLDVVKARFGNQPINWIIPAFDLDLMAAHMSALRRKEPSGNPSTTFPSATAQGLAPRFRRSRW